MNKAVHALVYVILAVAGVALYFEMNLFEKKELLKDSNEQLRNCIVKLSSFIEAEDAPAAKPIEVGIDKEPCEAREVDDPQLTQLLDDYHPEYEKANLTLLKWGDAQAVQLRKLYDLDADGNKKPDPATPGKFITKGPGTAQELVDKITERASKQNEVLNKTRNELANLRGKLQTLAGEYNKLPKEIRLGKIEIEKKEKEIEKLTTEKAAVEDQLQKSKSEVEELKTEVTSLKEEVSAAKDETEAVKEDLNKAKETVVRLTNMLKTQSAPRAAASGPAAGGGQMTSGDKGKISAVDNERLYAVVKFEDAALDELIGAERNGALPPNEMLVTRAAKGADGKDSWKIVGRIRLRQWTPKTNLVTVDILPDWQQAPIEVGDVVRPD